MSSRLRITRTVRLPDRLRMARFSRAPELGPVILFFSGGSALNPLSRVLINYTHNSIHLITPFDSGGSSAKLRNAFFMPAVGDLRNRLMALADQSVRGNPAIGRLFSCRLPKNESLASLEARLDHMVGGRDPLMAAIPDPMRKIVRNHLGFFQKAKSPDFDLRGASLGNLVLTGGYLNNDRHLDPVVYLFAKLAEVRGVVRPILNQDLHLATELENGEVLVGQHLLTGREVEPITSPVKQIHLSASRDALNRVAPGIRKKTVNLIESADLICYPMGSFYSSVLANLLPSGVAEAVAENDCPKIFIPNTGRDLEALDCSVARLTGILAGYLTRGAPGKPLERLLGYVAVDSRNGPYENGIDKKALESLGLQVIDTTLVTRESHPYIDAQLLAGLLLSLA